MKKFNNGPNQHSSCNGLIRLSQLFEAHKKALIRNIFFAVTFATPNIVETPDLRKFVSTN